MTQLLSWGRYPPNPQVAISCDWTDQLQSILLEKDAEVCSTLAFGNGRSYGDSCLALTDQVVHTKRLNRLISADWNTGVIVAQAGASLDEILSVCVEHGWFLPVTPGTKFATLGGAVANDVHGKNHLHAGTFGSHVLSLKLIRSDEPSFVCSATERSADFFLTIGGLGLTGIIEWVCIKLIKIESSQIDCVNYKFSSLDEFFSLSEELDVVNQYSVAWIDCSSTGRSLGRGIYSVGSHSNQGSLKYLGQVKLKVPLTLPFSPMNRFTLKAFNTLYFSKQIQRVQKAVVAYDAFFYPLDSILEWNRLYGKRGFQQYQCVLPRDSSKEGIRSLLTAIADSGSGSFLAVLKRFGPHKSQGVLSFPMEGFTLALDFPQKGNETSQLFAQLDAIVLANAGRLYPAKDAHMSAKLFQATYPNWAQLEAVRDPMLISKFWKRVTQS
jgi:FAD/FMN-containing dehydrogenase